MAQIYVRFPSGAAASTSASVGPTGSTAPTSATEVGFVDGSGNLQPFSGTNAGSGPNVTVTSSSLPAGSATAANQVTQEATLTSIQANQTNGTQHTIVDSSALPTGSATAANQATQISSLASILANQTNGTQIAQTTAPADVAPATQNITVQDTGSTTTAMANSQSFITGAPTAGSAASFTVSSKESVEVQVTGTWTGTLQVEVSLDGGTTWFTRGIKQSGVPYISTSFTNNFAGGQNVGGMSNMRVRATTAFTGTATVKIVESANVASVTVSNSLTLRDSTVQSISSTIKAASTAAVATDTAMVVAISPNNGVTANAGTNLNTSALALESGGNLGTIATNSGSISASGNLTTTSQSVVLNLTNQATTTITILGSYVGVLTFQFLEGDGVTWFSPATNGYPAISGLGPITFVQNTTGTWSFPNYAYKAVRVFANGMTSGTANVYITASPAVAFVKIIQDTAGNCNVTGNNNTNSVPLESIGIASAAITTTTTSATIIQAGGTSYMTSIPVTAVSGTLPTMSVVIQESADAGSNWYNVYTFPTITTTGNYNSPVLTFTGNRLRYVQTIGGTTPSFTRAISNCVSQQANYTVATGAILANKSGTTSATPSTSTQVMAANQTRRYLIIQNLSAVTAIYINFTAAADTTNSLQIAPLGSYVMESSVITTEAINVLSTGASIAYAAKEG